MVSLSSVGKKRRHMIQYLEKLPKFQRRPASIAQLITGVGKLKTGRVRRITKNQKRNRTGVTTSKEQLWVRN